MNFLHIPGQGLGVLLVRIFIKTEIRSFWVRTPNLTATTSPTWLHQCKRIALQMLASSWTCEMQGVVDCR